MVPDFKELMNGKDNTFFIFYRISNYIYSIIKTYHLAVS